MIQLRFGPGAAGGGEACPRTPQGRSVGSVSRGAEGHGGSEVACVSFADNPCVYKGRGIMHGEDHKWRGSVSRIIHVLGRGAEGSWPTIHAGSGQRRRG